jgi:flagellar protein FliJ
VNRDDSVRTSMGYRAMKPRETALRLKRFEADEKARKVADIELMIREFENIASDLDRQIQAEEDRTGIKDPAHFSYSTFAKSASARRDNLRSSADELKSKLDAAVKERDEAAEQLTRAATAEPRETERTSSGRHRSDRSTGAALR